MPVLDPRVRGFLLPLLHSLYPPRVSLATPPGSCQPFFSWIAVIPDVPLAFVGTGWPRRRILARVPCHVMEIYSGSIAGRLRQPRQCRRPARRGTIRHSRQRIRLSMVRQRRHGARSAWVRWSNRRPQPVSDVQRVQPPYVRDHFENGARHACRSIPGWWNVP